MLHNLRFIQFSSIFAQFALY